MAKKVRLAPGALHAKIAFDEAKHRRGPGGKFAFKGGPKKPAPYSVKNAALKDAGKTSGIKDSDVIKLHVDANPKKAGSSSAEDFAHYKDGMSVGAFKDATPKATAHLAWDIKKGYISVHDPATLPKAKKELTKDQYIAAGKISGIGSDDVIKIHVTENPKKAGSKSAEEFAKLRDEMTVGEYVAAVGDKKKAMANIAWDKDKGFLSVHGKADLQALRTGEKLPPTGVQPKAGVPKAADLPNDTVLVTKDGIELEVGKFKELTTHSLKAGQTAEDSLQESMNKGVWKVKLADGGPKFGSAGKSGTLVKVADIKSDEYLVLNTKISPFEDSSPEGIKFKAFGLKSGAMTKAQYDATQALTPEGKAAALQKLIDGGHVSVTTKAGYEALQKAKQASAVKPVQMSAQEAQASVTWKSDDPRWSKAAGVTKPGDARSVGAQRDEMFAARDAMGARVVDRNASSSLAHYKGNGYKSINGQLRAGEAPGNHALEMDKLMAPTKGDVYMFRGVSADSINSMPPPKDITDLGFSSVSFNPRISQSFAGGKTLLRIRVPKGTPAVHIGSPDSDTELSFEAEVVLARGTRFRYVTHETVNGYKTIELEVVQPDGSPYNS